MISGAISSEDYVDALRLHRRKIVKRQLLALCAFAAIGVVVAATVSQLVGIILIGAGVGGLIGEFALSTLTLPRRARKIYNQQAALRAYYTYSWDRDGISVTSENVNARRPWSDYVKTLEGDDLILLYHSDIMFEIFPKSWFANKEHFDEFRSLAARATA